MYESHDREDSFSLTTFCIEGAPGNSHSISAFSITPVPELLRKEGGKERRLKASASWRDQSRQGCVLVEHTELKVHLQLTDWAMLSPVGLCPLCMPWRWILARHSQLTYSFRSEFLIEDHDTASTSTVQTLASEEREHGLSLQSSSSFPLAHPFSPCVPLDEAGVACLDSCCPQTERFPALLCPVGTTR